MIRHLLLAGLLLVAFPALAEDEDLDPDSTQSSDNGTSCDSTPHATINDDPDDEPSSNTWCTADDNNTSWTFTVTMPTPSSSLDNTTDAQVIEFYVRQFDEAQTGEPTIQVDIYDGASCVDLHENGTPVVITAAGYPAKVTEYWTASGISGAADVCVMVTCTKSGGAPGARNSCDIESLEWDVAWGGGSGRSRRMF